MKGSSRPSHRPFRLVLEPGAMATLVVPDVHADHAAPSASFSDTVSATFPSSPPQTRTSPLRLFLVGQALFQSGTWMQLVAQSWLALELTDSSATLGWLATATFGPILVLGPWTGAVADRFDRRRLLLLTHWLAAAQAAVLAWSALTGTVGVALLYALALAHGLVYAVEHPTRRAFVAELVGEPELIRATSLASAVSAGAMVIGPALAGAVMVRYGLGWCFVANVLACLVAIALVTKVRRVGANETGRPARWRGQAGAGLRYVWHERELRTTLLLTAAVTTFGFNHHVVVPVLVRRAFGGGAGAYTLVVTAMAVGAVLGAMAAARRTSVDLASLRWSALAFGAVMTAATMVPTLAAAVVTALITGATGFWFVCRATSLLQLRAAPAMRGRVMALSAVVMLGSAPVGGPIVGWVCEELGPRWGLALGAAAALAGGAATRRTPPCPSVGR